MIKYNNSNINDWFYNASDIIKVYHNGAVCYYKIDVSSPSGQTPCFAVVDDISQYSDTEFEDVFNKADEKWYKLNNLNQYEQYGVYGSGRTITTYEGKLTIDDGYEYQYSGGSWINVGEVSGSTITLPNVPFVLNYNAANYDATTHSIPMTSGQLNDTDAVAYNNPDSIVDHHGDGYITISNSSMRIRKENQDISLFNRNDGEGTCELTIITKALTRSGCNIITNRDSDYNWMYRQYESYLTFHGISETGNISCSQSNPDIMSVRVYYDSGTMLKLNNWTQNTSTTPESFTYGSTNSDSSSAGALFVGYAWVSPSEQWGGDFYWVYMAQANLTDAQIQQVIDYNEEGGGQSEYPLYYTEKQDPPNNLSFSSMTEAEEYECPWVGVTATISGTDYIFDENYLWATKYQWVTVPNDYVCVSGDKYSKLEKQQRNIDDTWTSLGVYTAGTLIESASTDCAYACNVNLCGIDTNGDDISYISGSGNLDSVPFNIVEGIVGALTTSLNAYAFSQKSYLTALTIGDTVETINHECFQDTTGLTTLTIPSSVTEIGFWAFARMGNCQEIIFENTSVYSIVNNGYSLTAVFHDWYPPVIYVPDESVSAYRAKGISWYIDSVSTYPNIDDWIQPISNR